MHMMSVPVEPHLICQARDAWRPQYGKGILNDAHDKVVCSEMKQGRLQN